ncbi:MAG: hypothetical protein EOP49_14370, partial [Sphingobacteriales bacterium]
MTRNKINLFIAIGMILMAAASRILNHELGFYNLAPVAAIGLFGGAVLKDRRLAFLMPLLALFIADVYIELFPSNAQQRGFYGAEQAFVYGGMLMTTVLGLMMKQVSAKNVLGFSLAGSLVFFIISNLGAYTTGMYGFGFSSLVTTYEMAIPFFRNSLLGDLIGNTALFGSFYLLQQTVASKM